MTQWSDGPGQDGPGQQGPPPVQYGPPSNQYGPPAQYGPPPVQYGPPTAQYGPPAQYGYAGSGYRPKAPRETGALVVCIVLLVLALIGCFLASAAVYGSLTDDSSSSGTPAGGGYARTSGVPSSAPVAPGNGAPGNGAPGNGAPGADDAAVHVPVYPGARRVASPKPYLKPGGLYYKHGSTNYVTRASVKKVYDWYRAHLAAHHLKFASAFPNRDLSTHKLSSVAASVTGSGEGVAEFELQAGTHGVSVLEVLNYG